MDAELKVAFPKWFGGGDLNYIEQLRRMVEIMIDMALDPEIDRTEEMAALEAYFLEQNRPKSFDPRDSGNAVLAMEESFEATISGLEESGIHGASCLSVFSFYSRIKYFEKRNNDLKNGSKR